MKKIIVLVVLLSGVIFSQESKNNFLSSPELSLFGGISSENFSDIEGVYYFEGAANITQNLFAKLSLGYYKSVSTNSYTINTYKLVAIDNYKKYHTISYDVVKTEYQVYPIVLGLQYYFYANNFTPYLFFDFSFNFIDPLTFKTPESWVGTYDTIEEIPIEYKNVDVLPNNSFGLSLGFGAKYNLFSKIKLNFRYLYKLDSEIFNTHQILIGLSI